MLLTDARLILLLMIWEFLFYFSREMSLGLSSVIRMIVLNWVKEMHIQLFSHAHKRTHAFVKKKKSLSPLWFCSPKPIKQHILRRSCFFPLLYILPSGALNTVSETFLLSIFHSRYLTCPVKLVWSESNSSSRKGNSEIIYSISCLLKLTFFSFFETHKEMLSRMFKLLFPTESE